MSMENVKVVFSLPRADACALACIAEQDEMTMQLLVRKIVQAEVLRREYAAHVAEHDDHCKICKMKGRLRA
ncbi:MAG: hypothetical protein QG604_820 [Candidatus Dependentiae bacterium]|nr:hypothetical protein [Candidatus Dependentiae bacterium]